MIRRQIVDALRTAGGRIEDSSGLASRQLAERIGYTSAMSVLSGVLRRMELDGLVERDVAGKWTRAIALKGHLSCALVESPPAAKVELPAPAAPVEDERARAVTPAAAQAIADALLESVLARMNEPTPDEVKVRLGHALDESQRARRVVVELRTAMESMTAERDALRVENRRLQANLAAALDEGRRVLSDADRRALARFMQERPHNGH